MSSEIHHRPYSYWMQNETPEKSKHSEAKQLCSHSHRRRADRFRSEVACREASTGSRAGLETLGKPMTAGASTHRSHHRGGNATEGCMFAPGEAYAAPVPGAQVKAEKETEQKEEKGWGGKEKRKRGSGGKQKRDWRQMKLQAEWTRRAAQNYRQRVWATRAAEPTSYYIRPPELLRPPHYKAFRWVP